MIDIYNTDKKYKIIYVDPPWQYKLSNNRGSAESHYRTMSIEDIKKIPISKICDKSCSLFLWVTFPFLKKCFELLETWNFEYKTVAFVWIKTTRKNNKLFYGLGYYTRSNVELCLLATNGKKLPTKNHSIHQIVISKVREHSRKPDEVRDKIVELLGDLPRIELFAREETLGWDSWGNQTNLFKKDNKKEEF